jgi:hypothetical protein
VFNITVFEGSAEVLMRLAAQAEVAEITNNSDSDIPESSLSEGE